MLVLDHVGHVEEALILTGAMDAKNTFDAPETVHPVPFTEIDTQAHGGHTRLTFTLPPAR